mmetsp:Transcript_27796/g.54067  ORF Transcript_27796/g.54067 Transcript_27796/m.54067 type:complete len:243 (+) Transcript_27796:3-731(+)
MVETKRHQFCATTMSANLLVSTILLPCISFSAPTTRCAHGIKAPINRLRSPFLKFSNSFNPTLRSVVGDHESLRVRASNVDNTVSLLDAFCNVDTGEGCEEDQGEAVSVELELELGSGKVPVPAVFELDAPTNSIKSYQLGMPLGIVFEELDDGKIKVAELDPNGSAVRNGVEVGDILRATTCVVQKKRADFTYWVGGVGESGKTKALFTTDGASFGKAMAEIKSNAQLDGSVTLVLERPSA